MQSSSRFVEEIASVPDGGRFGPDGGIDALGLFAGELGGRLSEAEWASDEV